MGTLRDLLFALQLKIEELRQRDTLIDELELELDTKDELIWRLQGELDRHRATAPLPGASSPDPGCSSQGEERQKSRRKTIISEPVPVHPPGPTAAVHRSCSKSPDSLRLIEESFSKSDLLRNLDAGQIRAALDSMCSSTVKQGCRVIQEGTKGAVAYVLDDGKLDVTKDGQKLYTVDPGDVFGELALLYDCTHSYTVTALTDSRLWIIERQSFQSLLMQTGLRSLTRSMELLSSVPFLQPLPRDVLMHMSDLMEETHYSEGDYIIRQGATGDTFYIISKGQVKVMESKCGCEEPLLLGQLSSGRWFGEKALWGEDVRTVNMMAASDVTCLVIDREVFKYVVAGLMDDSSSVQKSNHFRTELEKDAALLAGTTLSDFQVICNLAAGETGHVDLVQLRSGVTSPLAMRVLRKRLVLDSRRQEHVLRERRILMEARCPFIVRLHQTFKDAVCLYMLTEACVGGNLWSLLLDRGSFDDGSARFYTACVVEALHFLHCHNIVYRDLKPENVVMDTHGYAKLIGSGCTKKVEQGQKTWTFCGTPGYIAPEILLSRGYSLSADLWSLGVLVFELLSGSLPFSGPDPVKTFDATIRGICQVNFPKTISKTASSLIKRLCRNNPSERLGSQRNGAKDIQKHKWFEGFNWEGLCKGLLSPPVIPKFIPPVESSTTGYYNEQLLGSPEHPTNWDEEF